MSRVRDSWDLIITIILSILLILTIYIDPQSIIRKVLGLLFILFLPGYAFISFLFPEKRDLDVVERIALSFGLSIAIVPLIGLLLNYTQFGIRLIPVLLCLTFFNIIFALFAIQRRFKARDPFIPKIEVKKAVGWDEMSKFDKILTVILIISIVVSIAVLVYIIVTPKQSEKFTEFYILGPNGKAADYPTNLIVGQNATVILGVVNHEGKIMNYTIEIWLVNATYTNNKTVIHHMYFLDRFNITLKPIPVNINGNWTPEWEAKYNFSINKTGYYKIWFLLFKNNEPPLPSKPVKMKDYVGTFAEKRIFEAIEGKVLSLNLNIHVRKI